VASTLPTAAHNRRIFIHPNTFESQQSQEYQTGARVEQDMREILSLAHDVKKLIKLEV
jgi:hypothetical protein